LVANEVDGLDVLIASEGLEEEECAKGTFIGRGRDG